MPTDDIKTIMEWVVKFLENFEQRSMTEGEQLRMQQLYAEGEDPWEAAARVAEGR